ncbi:hypothetical protein DFP72DRAFT_1041280 [Ephemerocybe angulata]|uniref:RRM domain-containing protein n=1 Tax=Ephemerocybe angulata TaxID=980116 RepID=A0A8H6IF92_9AGAR|nr:hypothetical protein DFP72DRAFT_1041280 [Tulosesus angulatus]
MADVEPTQSPPPQNEEDTVVDDGEEEESKEIMLMKQRVEEMEREAKKLRELQAAAEANASAEGGEESMETEEEKAMSDNRSIYIGNVDYASTPEEIQAHFQACGVINRVTILCDKFTGHPKGYGSRPSFLGVSLPLLLRLPRNARTFRAIIGDVAGVGIVEVIEEVIEATVHTGVLPAAGDGAAASEASEAFTGLLSLLSADVICAVRSRESISAARVIWRASSNFPKNTSWHPLHDKSSSACSPARPGLRTPRLPHIHSRKPPFLPPLPTKAPTEALRAGKGLMQHINKTLATPRKKELLEKFFSRRSKNQLQPGSIVTVLQDQAPTAIHRCSHCYSTERSQHRTGIEMQFFVNSPSLKEVKLVRAPPRGRMRRAKLFYLRDAPSKMTGLAGGKK